MSALSSDPISSVSVPESVKPKAGWIAGTLHYSSRQLKILFIWLLWGDFAWAMQERALPTVMQLLFKEYKVSDTMVGLLFSSCPLALGLISGPVISYLSDRHRGPRGRRIPYLSAFVPIIVGSMLGLAFSPQMGEGLHRLFGPTLSLNFSILIFLSIFSLFFQLFCGMANGLYGALVNDVVPRVVIGRFFGLFRILSLLIGSIFNYWLLSKVEGHYVWFFLGIAVLYGAGFSLMCLNVKEGQYPPPPASLKASWFIRFKSAINDYLKTGYGKSYYRWYFAATILAGMSFVPVNLYSVFYAKSIQMSMGDYGKYIAVSFVVSVCLAYPLGSLADRFHPLRLVIVVLGAYFFAALWGFLYAKDAASFGIALMAHTMISGCFFSVALSLPQKLLPQGQFAQIVSAGGILGSLITIVFAPAIGALLDHTGHAYQWVFCVGSVVAGAAFFVNLILHSQFMALGGLKGYVAPESSPE